MAEGPHEKEVTGHVSAGSQLGRDKESQYCSGDADHKRDKVL